MNVPAIGGGSGWSSYGAPYYQTAGPNGVPVTFVPTFLFAFPIGTFFAPSSMFAPGWNGHGVAGPLPPTGVLPQLTGVGNPKPKKADPARMAQLLTFGDRLFRAGNFRRAGERYEQAARADPHSAAPRVRLAQVALVRGLFAEAADQFREAQDAEPGWLARAADIQVIYAEPADFARQVARLESHLQASPNDRDAWLVLGAQWYLSGRTRKAADVFLRLTDRQPDPTLAAFLDATRPEDLAR